MEVVLIDQEIVKNAGRLDYDFYDPNHRDITKQMAKGYSKDKLGNICLRVGTGKTAPRNSYPDEGIRIIKVKNISGRGIKWNVEFYITEAFYEKAEQKAKVQIGDILMLCSAHNKSYIGRCDIIDTLPEKVIDDEARCACVGELIIIRANPEKVAPEYLVTFLRIPVVQEQIRRMVKGQSAHLYPKDLVNLDIVLPGKEIQKEIATINKNAENDYASKISQTENDMLRAKQQIEQMILNGKS